jgi:5-methyltetrahydrofolate--homocysteine methyltransferase
MEVVGVRFKNCEIYVPEVLVSARAMHAGMEILEPLLAASGVKARGTFVVGTVKGDLHDIGKNLVKALLQAYGFKVIDLGVDVTVKEFVNTAEKENANIIASSTLITTSLPYQRQMIQLLQDSGRREKFFIILGGGPVTPKWATDIGADGYGNSAQDAVELCRELMSGGKKAPLDEPVVIGAVTH